MQFMYHWIQFKNITIQNHIIHWDISSAAIFNWGLIMNFQITITGIPIHLCSVYVHLYTYVFFSYFSLKNVHFTGADFAFILPNRWLVWTKIVWRKSSFNSISFVMMYYINSPYYFKPKAFYYSKNFVSDTYKCQILIKIYCKSYHIIL